MQGKEENAVAPLCTTVTDHNNSFVQEALESQILEEPVPSIHGSERVVRLQVGSPVFSSELQNRAIPALTRAVLVFDVSGWKRKCERVEKSRKVRLSKSPVVVALNKIERAMAKLGYALPKGDVFMKNRKPQCIPSNTLAPSKSSCQSSQTTIN